MAAPPSSIESVYRAWVAALNDLSYTDIEQHLTSPFHHVGRDFTPQQWTEHLAIISKVLGPTTLTIDRVIADDSQNCLAARLLVKCRPLQPWMGHQPSGKDVLFTEMFFVWFQEGKLCRTSFNIETPVISRQLQDPSQTYDFDSALDTKTPSSPVSKQQMQETHDGFINMLNSKNMSEFPNIVQEQVVLNGMQLTCQGYQGVATGLVEAISDLVATVRTRLVDVDSQMMAAQIELAGTPVKAIQGCEPTGRAVRFNDHVMYKFEGGKICRVWFVPDLDTLDKQLREGTQ